MLRRFDCLKRMDTERLTKKTCMEVVSGKRYHGRSGKKRLDQIEEIFKDGHGRSLEN